MLKIRFPLQPNMFVAHSWDYSDDSFNRKLADYADFLFESFFYSTIKHVANH